MMVAVRLDLAASVREVAVGERFTRVILGVLLTGAILQACNGPVAEVRKTAPSSSPSERDLGEQTLASVNNAIFAIRLKSSVVASNDVSQASRFAIDLSSRSSRLLPVDPTPIITHGVPSGETSKRAYAYGAQAELMTAQTALVNEDLPRADLALVSIRDHIPKDTVPADLAFFEAAQSLSLARAPAAASDPSDLSVQLITARAALDSYSGRRHSERAKAVASEISRYLNRSDIRIGMPAGQLGAWWGEVRAWG